MIFNSNLLVLIFCSFNVKDLSFVGIGSTVLLYFQFLTPKEKKNETLPATDEGGDVDDLVSTVKTERGFRTQVSESFLRQ